MDYSNTIVILLLAFSVGMLHALDADHVIAVSALSRHRKNMRSSIRFCLSWTLGHSLTLLSIGVAVFLLGMAIPAEMSRWAELLVGVMLIGIGIAVIISLRKQKAHLHFHRHDSGLLHAHWHTHESNAVSKHSEHKEHHHRAVLVGMLHGAAGSAPLIALLPLGIVSSPWLALAYLVLFSAGVFVAMLLVGGVLGSVFGYLHKSTRQLIHAVSLLLGSVSIVLGGLLIKSVILV